ncbi:MAG: hypothetical protein EGQ16_00540, partial [Clostridiales bacterium]|nr:hypothetical protein [Clostridiales bacterium]
LYGTKEKSWSAEEEGNKEYISAKIDENAMNILLFTSGTTSKSKAVMLSQKNIASNVYAMQRVEDIRSTDSNLAFLPMHHIFGSTCLIVMLACGARTSFPDGLRYVAQNLKEYEVSVFVGVPLLVEAIYNKVVKEIDKQGKTKLIKNAIRVSNFLLKFHIDIRRKLFKQLIDQLGGKMRFVISGGAPLDPKIQKGFIDLGINVAQGYGLTETSPVIAAENMYKSRTGSIGVPMENVTVEIVNKDDNGIGELRAKGPNVMLGYYENEEETNKVLKDGWFYTGDLGYIDKDGFIFITGRQKSIGNIKNIKFETIIIDLSLNDFINELCTIKHMCDVAKYVVINTDINTDFNIYNFKSTVITYGLNRRATITISSITESSILIYLQRNLKCLNGETKEIGEEVVRVREEGNPKIYEVLIIYSIFLIKQIPIMEQTLEKTNFFEEN